MKNIWFTLALLSVAGISASAAPAKGTGKPIAVVVSASMTMDNIESSTLRRVFSAEPTETGAGGRFVPLNQEPGSAARVTFDKTVLKLDPDQVSNFWIDQRIRGNGKPPRSIPNQKLLVQLLPKVPGSIAYVDADFAGADVKILKVDGKKPGEPGYPLQ